MSQFERHASSLTLRRFPGKSAETSHLQAWDAADEYLLDQPLPNRGPVLIFNDQFGALACALAPREVISVSDSWLSQLATRQNLQLNGLNEAAVTFLDSLAPLPQAPACVLIKIPKSLALLEYQLYALRKVVTPQTLIIAGAKARDIHTSTLRLFERILGETRTSLARKKARLVYSTVTLPPLKPIAETTCWSVEMDGQCWQIHNHASLFSRTSLDIGARFFLQHLPTSIDGEIIDLGCGNGVIGLQALTVNPSAELHFVDESYMAVASSERNVRENLPQALSRSRFHINNALAGFPADRAKVVLCNPPFHQQHTVTEDIAWQMFKDARRCLQYGGELRIVANRHLNYYRQLKKQFGNCTTLASNAKFVILRSVKLR
ncbi:23S rRNA (guanine(1835)-N(2))-methyltransferase RlmG [Enterobacteriaceae bacterium LUAb1]